jgi:SAM-dependent methyltransferase
MQPVHCPPPADARGRRFRDHTSLSAEDYADDRQGRHEDRRFEAIDTVLGEEGTGWRVLEIGSGGGSLLARIAAAHPTARCVGVEASPDLAAHAHENYASDRVLFQNGDIRFVPATHEFDFAFSVDVIHHFQDRVAAFQAIRGALGGGARWLAIEPNVLHPYVALQQERMRRAGLDEDHFRPWQVIPELRRCGFSVARRSHMLLFPKSFTPGPRLAKLERRFERLPLLGGATVLLIRAV